ncbi:MAG: YraN family protein, partial [candidate division KSB1 bacterium]|nr:YraN family protein [candidate division KSB1 bacterium]
MDNQNSKEKQPSVGKLGENLAAKFLEDKGYHILERNYRYGHGELDIIAEKDGMLIFI